jgi:hypothetical protein
LHRQLPRTRACTLLAAVALAAVACSSSDADKAGGTMAKPPVVFTLADHEQSPAQVQFWIEEVQRRAGGSLDRGHQSLARLGVAFDKATIADVQAGEASWPRSPPAPTTSSAETAFRRCWGCY